VERHFSRDGKSARSTAGGMRRRQGDRDAIEKVHVFICTGRFRSFKEMRGSLTRRTPRTGTVPSPFMRESA
jgi:hypothetical protein